MICPNCRTENENTSKFCKECSADLKTGAVSKNRIITEAEENLRTVVELRHGTVAVRQTEVPAEVVIKEGKPGALTAVAIMMLIAGILNLLNAVGWFFIGLSIFIVGVIFTIIPAIYCGMAGVYEVIYAAKLLAKRPDIQEPPYFVSILGIISIIFFNIESAILEIINLALMSGTEVKEYLSSD
jgi:uncharacterized membrane-anchored protein